VNRTSLIIVLCIGVAAGFVFTLYPEVDLSIAQVVHEDTNVDNGALARWPLLITSIIREIGLWIEILLTALPIIALVGKLTLPRMKMLIPGRAAIFLLSSLAVGPGLLVNVALKNHWERPRPGQLLQFSGTQHFVPWWEPIGDCHKNCSFVSGEASSAFWTIAPAALAPAEWRPLAYAAAIAFGSIISISRIMVGGHFLSDTIFAGVFTFVIIWLLHAALYRWKPTQLDDAAIETTLESVSAYCRRAWSRLARHSLD
jgi:lipid A 4'-phosphatase